MNSKILYRIITLSFLLLGLMANKSYAATYDVTSQFSSSVNPNTPWSYGWKSGLLQPFNLSSISSGLWVGGNGTNIWKNTGPGYAYGVAPGEVSMHPGFSDFSVIRWTAIFNGSVNIAGYFGAGDGGNMSYFIYHNNTPSFAIHNSSGNGLFNINKTVSIGDTIDFMIGENFAYGNTPLHAVINATENIPAPATIWLLSTYLVAFVWLPKKQLHLSFKA